MNIGAFIENTEIILFYRCFHTSRMKFLFLNTLKKAMTQWPSKPISAPLPPGISLIRSIKLSKSYIRTSISYKIQGGYWKMQLWSLQSVLFPLVNRSREVQKAITFIHVPINCKRLHIDIHIYNILTLLFKKNKKNTLIWHFKQWNTQYSIHLPSLSL